MKVLSKQKMNGKTVNKPGKYEGYDSSLAEKKGRTLSFVPFLRVSESLQQINLRTVNNETFLLSKKWNLLDFKSVHRLGGWLNRSKVPPVSQLITWPGP